MIALGTAVVIMRGRHAGRIGVVTSTEPLAGVLVDIDAGIPYYFMVEQIAELEEPEDEMGEVPC